MSVDVDKMSAIYIRHIYDPRKLELRGKAIKLVTLDSRSSNTSLQIVPQADHCVLQTKLARGVLYPVL